jgi:hypothetical protein
VDRVENMATAAGEFVEKVGLKRAILITVA